MSIKVVETNHHNTLANGKLLCRFSIVLEIVALYSFFLYIYNKHSHLHSRGGKGEKNKWTINTKGDLHLENNDKCRWKFQATIAFFNTTEIALHQR